MPISEDLYNEIFQNRSGKLFSCGYGVVWKWLNKCFPDLPQGQATHILRHTFASYFMMNGGNILVLQKILGHVDIKQTMAYSHFAPSHLQDAVLFNPLASMPQKSGDEMAMKNTNMYKHTVVSSDSVTS